MLKRYNFKINAKHELCEECIEYVCCHTYSCLSLENCSICLEDLLPSNVVYLNVCGHKYHRSCILTTTAYAEVARSTMLKEEHELEIEMINADFNEGLITNSQRIASKEIENNRYSSKVGQSILCPQYKCPYCTIESNKLLTYEEVFQLCCNSIMPPIAFVSAGEYHYCFNKYKLRLKPTPQMLDYLKNTKELFGEELLQNNLNDPEPFLRIMYESHLL